MSDMIDRLQAISVGAGRDIATDLAQAATLRAMEAQVRRGVRVRRTRIGAGVAGLSLVAGAVALLLPGLLKGAPVDEVDPATPVIIRSDGAITTLSDGSMSVVLTDGRLLHVAPNPVDGPVIAAMREEEACAFEPSQMAPTVWRPVTNDYAPLVGGAYAYLRGDERNMSLVFGGEFTYESDAMIAPVVFEFAADPSIAENIVVRVRWFEVNATTGEVYHYATSVTADAEVRYEGSAEFGTRRGIVGTGPLDDAWFSYCYPDREYLTHLRVGDFREYLIADVFLVDRVSTIALLGSFGATFDVTFLEAE